MKSQRLQHEDLKKEFREACKNLSNPSNYNRKSLNRRTAALSALYRENVISDMIYRGLLMTEEVSVVPQELM